MSKKVFWGLGILSLIFLLSIGSADSSSVICKNGYAARWLLETSLLDDELKDAEGVNTEISGEVNCNIDQSVFYELYPDYSPVGDYQWLGEWIREGAHDPISVGDRLVHDGGAPFIIITESKSNLFAEADDDSAILATYSFGIPIWVIGKYKEWFLCVKDFSAWTYSDEPEQLICGWVHSDAVLPLPVGLWDGSSDESIETNHLRIDCSDNTLLYAMADVTSDIICTVPKGSNIDAYYCSTDENWYVCWYKDMWGYVWSP